MGQKTSQFEQEEFSCLMSDIEDAEESSFGKSDRENYEISLKAIRAGFKKASNAYIMIGCGLWQIHHNEYYRIANFKNIAEFAENMFEIKKATCHNYIKVIERFGEITDGKAVGLKKEFKAFSCSQLVAMLTFTPEQIAQVKPSWKVKSIVDFGRGNLVTDQEEAGNNSDSFSKETPSASGTTAMESKEQQLDFMPVPELEAQRIPLATCDSFEDILLNRARLENAMNEMKNDRNFKNKKIRFVLELAFE